jgi:5-aminolevulinate synthase
VTPRHTLEQINKLVGSVDQIFTELGINRLQDWIRLGGRASVGIADSVGEVKPIWTDEQLGMRNGTTPKTLRNGEKAYLDPVAVEKARADFKNLLGPISGPVQATRGVYPVEADHEKSVVGSWKVKMGTGVLRKREALVASSTIAAAA